MFEETNAEEDMHQPAQIWKHWKHPRTINLIKTLLTRVDALVILPSIWTHPPSVRTVASRGSR